MGAEELPEIAVVALAEEIEIHVAERRQEAVRVSALPGVAVAEAEAEPIVARWIDPGQEEREEAAALRLQRQPVAVWSETIRDDRIGMKCADDRAGLAVRVGRVKPENRMRTRMLAGEESCAIGGANHGRSFTRGSCRFSRRSSP